MTVPLPLGRYGVIYADPPWAFSTRSDKGRDRCPDARHYAVMGLDEIKALPVAAVAAKDCVLLLWTTDPMLPRALEVMAAWGFVYKTVGFYWAKMQFSAEAEGCNPMHPAWWPIGTGYHTRANPEQCLLGTSGSPKRLARDVRRLVVSPRKRHSEKPLKVVEGIERLYAGPYLELFARPREVRTGWTYWGDQAAPPAQTALMLEAAE